MTDITPDKIEGLLAFLPAFEVPNRTFLEGWQGLAPVYPQDVSDFYQLASEGCWMDYAYEPAEAGRLIGNDDYITQANLQQLKTLITFCVRGERFSDGHWAAMLEHGRIQAILRRLQVLHATMNE